MKINPITEKKNSCKSGFENIISAEERWLASPRGHYFFAATSFKTCSFRCVRVDRERLGVLSIMPKIPDISVGIQMERFVSVFSDRNIRYHLWRWSTYFRLKFFVPSLTNMLFALIREFGKRIQNDERHFYWLAWFNQSENAVPFSSGNPTDLWPVCLV